MSISSPSAKAISTGLKTADTLLTIAEAFRGLGESKHERATYARVQTILDKVEEILGTSKGLSAKQASEIINDVMIRRMRSEDGERSRITAIPANDAMA